MGLILSYVSKFCLSSVQFYCIPGRWDVVCLVLSSVVCLGCSFRYWFLAASRLVARFARVRALRARCGPFGPAAGPSGPQGRRPTVRWLHPYPLINALEGG